ncbi:MAG: hypothetical protein NXY57DRAFT_1014561 [Lentinula lateritia]|uniref:F-box domain-containing protein n=1 Tax=Lentinula lateritia TaxID=40482 RepID=A0ABQ8VA78_9AGAR|nr:MAG: hypothetical protein NXY57DRAFT_1014561 [Lentinula lateritia]KAJ4481820.1 hypothetical protein C8R41DRAFT_841475 [Lentinula lateritia]
MPIFQQDDRVESTLEPVNPLDSLPNELMAKIFGAGIELDRRNELPRALITYCSVSSRWREICQHSSELWTDVRIPLRHTRPKEIVARTTIQLERSDPRPFDLILTIPPITMPTVGLFDDEPQYEFELIRDILNVLFPHLPRMRRLSFITELPYYAREVTFTCNRLGGFEAPQLSDIRLQFGVLGISEFLVPMDRIIPMFFKSLPRLKHQRVYGVDIQYPLHGLTSLHLSHLLPDETNFRYLSINSPALVELCLISLYPMAHAAKPVQSKISFPALRSLRVSFARRAFASGTCILALMSPPNLTSVEIRGFAFPDSVNSFPDSSLLTQLHTLRLEQVVFTSPNSLDVPLHDPSFYLGLTAVRHLQLISTSPQSLFPEPEAKVKPLLRARSGDFRELWTVSRRESTLLPPVLANELDSNMLSKHKGQLLFSPEDTAKSKSSIVHTHWPNLTTITLDTIRAKDVLWLCELVAVRPEIETVYLSRSAKRHLASLTMRKGEKKDRFSSWDVDMERKNLVRRRPDVEKGDMDPVGWLEQRVKVYELESDTNGPW